MGNCTNWPLIYGSNDYLDSLDTEEAKNEAKQNAIQLHIIIITHKCTLPI